MHDEQKRRVTNTRSTCSNSATGGAAGGGSSSTNLQTLKPSNPSPQHHDVTVPMAMHTTMMTSLPNTVASPTRHSPLLISPDRQQATPTDRYVHQTRLPDDLQSPNEEGTDA